MAKRVDVLIKRYSHKDSADRTNFSVWCDGGVAAFRYVKGIHDMESDGTHTIVYLDARYDEDDNREGTL